MYLQKLELNGFKSFARKIDLGFNQGITSIVGPNGSGKSNIAEAIRWVMGEQSIKSLRGKQSTDVIFSGSDKSTRLGLAEVTLFFNNEDHRAPLDFTEVSISRRIHRDGHSDYFLNGQSARLQDVLLLLAQVNLSSRTYSVIGQGMVDEILSVTPRERKDFFEEAAGVKPLQMKKQEALRKLGHTSENLQTVNIQLNEISPRLRSLTRQVNRLERRAEIENKLRDLQYHYYGEAFYNYKSQNVKFKGDEVKLVDRIDKLEIEVKSLQDMMFSLTRESSHSDKFTQGQEAYEKSMNQKAELREKELLIKNEILQNSKQNQKTHVPMSVIREVENRFQTLTKKLKDHKKTTNSHQSLEDWQQWYQVFDELLAEHNDLLRPLRPFLQEHDLSDKEQQLKNLQKEILIVDGNLNKVQRQIKDLAELEKKEKVKIWQTQNELQEQQKILNQLINERNDLRVNLARVETRMADLEAEVISDVGPEFLDRLQSWLPSKKHQTDGDSSRLKDEIHKHKHELELIGGIDPEIQKEHAEIKERYDFLETQTKDLEKGIKQLEEVVGELEETIEKQFNESFRKINNEFQKYFKTLFRGGKAELKLLYGFKQDNQEVEGEGGTGETQMLEEGGALVPSIKSRAVGKEIIGVDITATPPGKKIKTISVLSGGERALTSIALISAIISNNPAPFVVLDEVDAALDEENSMRFAEIVDELSHKTQFVIITHNRATMEHSDLLYGVTMGDDGISKLLSLKFEDAEQYTNR